MRRVGAGGEGEEAKQREKLVGAVFKNLQTLGHVWKIKKRLGSLSCQEDFQHGTHRRSDTLKEQKKERLLMLSFHCYSIEVNNDHNFN